MKRAESSDSHPLTDTNESFGDEILDKLLEEGVLKGHARMDLALVVAGAFVVAIWGFFTYFEAPSLPFIHQDYGLIVENQPLHRIATISEGWNLDRIRPLTALSLAIDWRVGGGLPAAFHFTSALLHTLNGILIFLLCRRLYSREKVSEVLCLGPALLFLAHPMLSLPAIYVSERGALLGTTFLLLATLTYLSGNSGRTTALALVLFTLAWSASAAAWPLPLVLAAAELALNRRVRWKFLAPFVFLSAAFLVVHVTTRLSLGATIPGMSGVLAQSGTTIGAFTSLFTTGPALPMDPSWVSSGFGSVIWITVAFFAAFALALAPRLGLALAWAATFFAAPGLLLGPDASAQYVAAAGLLTALPMLLVAIPSGASRAVAGTAIALVLFVLTASTFSQTLLWRNEEQLLQLAVADCTDCPALHERLATIKIASARGVDDESARQTLYSEAVDHLRIALERAPHDVNLWIDLGEAHAGVGDTEQAMGAYEKARLADPWSGEASLRLAYALLTSAGSDPSNEVRARTLDLFTAAYKVNALEERDYAQAAQLLTRVGEFESADALLRAGVEKTGSTALRTLLERNAQSVDAIKKREARIPTLTGREKTFEEAYLLHLRGRLQKSVYMLQADLAANGFNEQQWLLLGENKRRMGQIDDFIAEYRQQGIPSDVWDKLAASFREAGDEDAATAVANATPE